MKTLTKKIEFCFVEKVLREALVLEEDSEIKPKTKLIDLKAEPIDILDIYFRLGINFSDYISGERLNEKGKKLLNDLAKFKRKEYGFDLDGVLHFEALAQSNTTNKFINQLVASDLVDVGNYGATQIGVAI